MTDFAENATAAAIFHKQHEQWDPIKYIIVANHSLSLHIFKLTDLPPAQSCGCCLKWWRSGLCTAYCTISIDGDLRKIPWRGTTVSMPNSNNPVFNQQFHVLLSDIRKDVIRIEVWDKDVIKDEKIGSILIPVWDILSLVRDDENIVHMGLDANMLRIQYRINPSLLSARLMGLNTLLYLGITAKVTKLGIERARDYTKRSPLAPKIRKGSSSLASTNSSPIDSFGNTRRRSTFLSVGPSKGQPLIQKPSQKMASNRPTTMARVLATPMIMTPAQIAKNAIPDDISPQLRNDSRALAEFCRCDLDGTGFIRGEDFQNIYVSLRKREVIAASITISLPGANEKISFTSYVELLNKVMPLLVLSDSTRTDVLDIEAERAEDENIQSPGDNEGVEQTTILDGN